MNIQPIWSDSWNWLGVSAGSRCKHTWKPGRPARIKAAGKAFYSLAFQLRLLLDSTNKMAIGLNALFMGAFSPPVSCLAILHCWLTGKPPGRFGIVINDIARKLSERRSQPRLSPSGPAYSPHVPQSVSNLSREYSRSSASVGGNQAGRGGMAHLESFVMRHIDPSRFQSQAACRSARQW